MLNCFAALGLLDKNFSLSLLSPIFIYIFFFIFFSTLLFFSVFFFILQIFLVSFLSLSLTLSVLSKILQLHGIHSLLAGHSFKLFWFWSICQITRSVPNMKISFVFYFGRFIHSFYFALLCFLFFFCCSLNAI